MSNCKKCKNRGYLGAERRKDAHGYETIILYSGIRCCNSNCIFFKSPCKPLMDAGLDNCRGFEEVEACEDSDK